MTSIGVVVIGRNEGERLRHCLQSLVAPERRVVYVDSGSTDGSSHLAESMGALVHELDMRLPFCAARARNEGLRILRTIAPGMAFVQFVDADCIIRENWLETAVSYLLANPDVACVCGRLREREPSASIYNMLADLDWIATPGDVASCGGIAAYRIEAFEAVGGFDPSVTAGEEPELCLRLRNRGNRIVRLSDEMASHDMAMKSFSQWWRRQVRGGRGALDVATRFGERAFRRQVRSTRVWALGWPVSLVGAMFFAAAAPGPVSGVLLAGVALAPAAQAVRIAARTRAKGAGWRVAAASGVLLVIAKPAQLMGQLVYLSERFRGANGGLIEHKMASGGSTGFQG